MKVEQVKTPDDIERYVEGCINDFEGAISDKDETVVFLCELVVHIYNEALKEKCTIPNVINCTGCRFENGSAPICDDCVNYEFYSKG